MNLSEASEILNAIALRFAEFAITDTEAQAEWEALSKLSHATSDIARQNAAKYAKRAESREREAKAILFVLLKLSEHEEKANGRSRIQSNTDTASGGGERLDGASQSPG